MLKNSGMCSQTPRVELFFLLGISPSVCLHAHGSEAAADAPDSCERGSAKATGSGGHPSPRVSFGMVPAGTFAVRPDSVSSCFMSLAERFFLCIYIFMHQMFEIKSLFYTCPTRPPPDNLGNQNPRVENNVHSCTEVGCRRCCC